jgi:uroporphyrinogen-III synthase
MGPRPLEGFAIGITADRRAEEQATLLAKRGARVVHGPTIQMLPLDAERGLRAATDALIADPPHLLLATTGIGVRTWLAAAESWEVADELLASLREAAVFARGPKAAGALITAGIDVGWRAPSEQMAEVVDHVAALVGPGTRVAILLDGDLDHRPAASLASTGADVVAVPVYRCTLPADRTRANRLVEQVCARRLDAVTFTSAPAVRNLVELAMQAGVARELTEAFDQRVLAVCVGPVCRQTAESCGLATAIEPERPRLGSMVAAVTAALSASTRRLVLAGVPVTIRGDQLAVDGTLAVLTDRERDLLEALVRRAGAVASRPALLAEVWGASDADPHVLEVTVARLRRRLGNAGPALQTVVRRGYRLDYRLDVSTC